MLKKLILIENQKNRQFSTERELIEYLLGDNYYYEKEEERQVQMKINGKLNCANLGIEVIDFKDIDIENMEGKFVVYDEKTYLLSLLLTNRITLLEEKDANIYTKDMDKLNIKDNYIILNTFAQQLLIDYLRKIKNVLIN